MRRGRLVPAFWVDVAVRGRPSGDAVAATGMPRLGHDPGIMATAGQEKGYFGVGQQVQFVDRSPWGDMVALGADGEDRRSYIGERHRPPFDLVTAFGQVVAQEAAA